MKSVIFASFFEKYRDDIIPDQIRSGFGSNDLCKNC